MKKVEISNSNSVDIIVFLQEIAFTITFLTISPCDFGQLYICLSYVIRLG